MPENESQPVKITDDWLLANVPFVSFICDNDPLYSMRFMAGGGGEAFGYKLDDFVDNKQYFAASTTHPEDMDIVDAHAEQALAGGSPVVSRYRLLQADSELVPVLLISKAILDNTDGVVGFSGCCVDLRSVPEFQGPPGLLSELRPPNKRRPPVRKPENVDALWTASQLPVQTYYSANDEHYTLMHLSGSSEELTGYTGETFARSSSYKPASFVYPDDQDVADFASERNIAHPGRMFVLRMRVVNAEGKPFPVLIFQHGARPEETSAWGIAGGILDISHVPALQGAPGVFGDTA